MPLFSKRLLTRYAKISFVCSLAHLHLRSQANKFPVRSTYDVAWYRQSTGEVQLSRKYEALIVLLHRVLLSLEE
jgi:hypothetical protein